jgi:hypothetical protein
LLELADVPVDDTDQTRISQIVAGRCVELFDASAAGVLLTDRGGRLQVTWTCTLSKKLFELQTDEGLGRLLLERRTRK